MSIDIPKKLTDIEIFNTLTNPLAGQVQGTWEVAERLLRHAQGTHQKYTSHGPDHSLMLLKIINNALSPLKNTKLTDNELYILITATLLHDIGMVGKAESDNLYKDRVRDSHHLRTKSYINNNWFNSNKVG